MKSSLSKQGNVGQVVSGADGALQEGKGDGPWHDPVHDAERSPEAARHEALEPHLAFGTDNSVLVAAKDVDQRSLEGCELATYIILRGEDAARVLRMVRSAAAGIASQYLGSRTVKTS